MQATSVTEQEIIAYGTKKNLMIQPTAIPVLRKLDNFKQVLDQLSQENTFMIGIKEIETKVVKTKIQLKEHPIKTEKKKHHIFSSSKRNGSTFPDTFRV
jgi:hypothetical protein